MKFPGWGKGPGAQMLVHEFCGYGDGSHAQLRQADWR